MTVLWIAAVLVLFGLVGAVTLLSEERVMLLKWKVIHCMEWSCDVTGHRFCHVIMPKMVALMDRWGL